MLQPSGLSIKAERPQAGLWRLVEDNLEKSIVKGIGNALQLLCVYELGSSPDGLRGTATSANIRYSTPNEHLIWWFELEQIHEEYLTLRYTHGLEVMYKLCLYGQKCCEETGMSTAFTSPGNQCLLRFITGPYRCYIK